MSDVHSNIRDSSFDFQRVVWPVVAPWCGGGRLQPVEGTTDHAFARALDLLAGIDGFQIVDGRGIRGIASRVQYRNSPYSSFTIRTRPSGGGETEFDKRVRALEDRQGAWLLPKFTVQAYVSRRRTGDLLYVCMVDTADLFRFILEHPDYVDQRRNSDASEFMIVWCEDLSSSGSHVWEYTASGTSVRTGGRSVVELYQETVIEGGVSCSHCGTVIEGGWQCLECGGLNPYEGYCINCSEMAALEWVEWCPACD